jgi:hypothetical protein
MNNRDLDHLRTNSMIRFRTEMDTCWMSGEIRQVIAILDEVTQ